MTTQHFCIGLYTNVWVPYPQVVVLARDCPSGSLFPSVHILPLYCTSKTKNLLFLESPFPNYPNPLEENPVFLQNIIERKQNSKSMFEL